jgi:hypothetical protein
VNRPRTNVSDLDLRLEQVDGAPAEADQLATAKRRPERREHDRLCERPPWALGLRCLGDELVVSVSEPGDLRLGQHAHLGLDEARPVDAQDGVCTDQPPNDCAAQHDVQEQKVVLDRLRREPALRLEGDVRVDQLRARFEFGESMVAEEGEEVAAQHVAVVLDGRRLELPPRQVVVHETFGEVTERDAIGLAEAIVNGGEALAEFPLGLALGPRRFGSERLEHLLARGIPVLDPPDGASLASVADDGGSSGHRSPP